MLITREAIRQYCQSNVSFQHANELQMRGCVRNLHVKDVCGEEVTIGADVIENRKNYRVQATLNKEQQINQSSCSCGMGYWGICAHRGAFLLEYEKQSRQGEIKRVTSKAIQDLIYELSYRNKREAYKEKLAGDIELIPSLKIQDGVQVSFKIGSQKKYVIRSLTEFVDNVENGNYFEYGQKLKFAHDRAAFTEEALKMLDFIIENIENYHHISEVFDYEYYERALRYLPLSESELDKFMELCEDREILITAARQEKGLRLIRKNPDIKVYIEKENKGASIYFEDTNHVLMGTKRIYAVQSDGIYMSSEEYKEEMKPVFHMLTMNGEQRVFLSEDDYNTFCASILPVLSEHCEIEYREMDFQAYMPPATEIEIYLDSPEKNYVTCTIYAKYGGKKYNIFEKFNPIEVYRDVKTECNAYLLGKKYFAGSTKEEEQAFFIKNDDELLFHFLESGISDFQEIGTVFISDNFKGMKVISSPKVSIGVSLESGLLELTLDAGEMPLNQLAGLLDSYKRRKKFYRLKSGEFINLEDSSYSTITELADGLSLTARELKENKIILPQNRALYLDKILRESNEAVEYHRDIYFKNLIKNIKAVEDAEFEIPYTLKSTLREYQKNGYRWLKTLSAYGFGGILADDMGLGKTLQIIALLLSQKEEEKGTSLIVCPASLIYNWESELEKFAPELKTCIVAGMAQERKTLIESFEEYDVLVTSYDLLKRDAAHYNNILFETEIIDEAQYIKNQATQASKAVKAVQAKVKFALTGTPIENRLSELWSIFDYLMPGLLYSYRHFRNEIEAPIVQTNDEVSLKRLQRLISPFVLRRLKPDVLKDLPDKLENTIYSKMEGEQLELYQANVQLLRNSIDSKSDEEFKKNKLQILAELTKLRQLCCDPALYYDAYKGSSAKLEACMDLIENGVEGGHKILLFSQFTTMFDILIKKLDELHIPYFVLTGKTPKARRYQMVEEFNRDNTKVFLISLKAGGTGLNLTGADIVIHYDPWWNVSAQNQATDRAHRIGQKNVVSVFKLITKNSIEEKILNLQEMKKDLADKVISEDEISNITFDKNDLLELLS
ncbi:DEAD/DEAH box helicase [Konateibacter massiliensis]|uniref:DEAD/DEAH box helicase n=1 Tax=Konateibacter massiliensis TaxID=2002841 RepID=UPI000C150233|nr:DEAD/DEAH box helicase [Konateibacter massiliensis]